MVKDSNCKKRAILVISELLDSRFFKWVHWKMNECCKCTLIFVNPFSPAG